jgi:hypothetical protein
LLIALSAKAYGTKSAFQKKAGIFLAMQSSSHECKAYTVVTGTALWLINALTVMLVGIATLARFALLLT